MKLNISWKCNKFYFCSVKCLHVCPGFSSECDWECERVCLYPCECVVMLSLCSIRHKWAVLVDRISFNTKIVRICACACACVCAFVNIWNRKIQQTLQKWAFPQWSALYLFNDALNITKFLAHWNWISRITRKPIEYGGVGASETKGDEDGEKNTEMKELHATHDP